MWTVSPCTLGCCTLGMPPGWPWPVFTKWRIQSCEGTSPFNVVMLSGIWLCNPTDFSLPVSSVSGIFQARILEWVAVSYSKGSFPPRNQTRVSCIAGRFFTTEPLGKLCLLFAGAKSLQSCPILCGSLDCSPPGFSVQGVLLTRILQWVAMSCSKGSSWHRDGTSISYTFCIVRHVLYH